MCETAIVHRVGRTLVCESLGELRAALPGCVVILPYMRQSLPDADCLCHVDFRATAASARMRVEPPFTDPDEWAWVFRDA